MKLLVSIHQGLSLVNIRISHCFILAFHAFDRHLTIFSCTLSSVLFSNHPLLSSFKILKLFSQYGSYLIGISEVLPQGLPFIGPSFL